MTTFEKLFLQEATWLNRFMFIYLFVVFVFTYFFIFFYSFFDFKKYVSLFASLFEKMFICQWTLSLNSSNMSQLNFIFNNVNQK